nr:hypothetical protein Iba_chr01dCG17670 [Ipomoea batatas]
MLCNISHCFPHLFSHESFVRVLNNGRKGAIVVQKHYYLFPFRSFGYAIKHPQSRRITKSPRIVIIILRRCLGRRRIPHGVQQCRAEHGGRRNGDRHQVEAATAAGVWYFIRRQNNCHIIVVISHILAS